MIEVLATSVLNSVQDLGRTGHFALGVGSAGAMDALAMRLANVLLGNDEHDAVVEVQTFPFELRFDAASTVAVTGAQASIHVGGRAWPDHWCEPVAAGASLRIDAPVAGARCYVAVPGGFDVPPVLGSRSTALRGGFGGHEGRALRVGDRLRAARDGEPPAGGFGIVAPRWRLPSGVVDGMADGDQVIRVMPAAEYEDFTPQAQAALWDGRWKVTAQSDRMGYRFAGAPLHLREETELRSYGLVPGLIQVPPGGQPIVQLSDANTMGGYPRAAAVIEADLWRLAQARPGSMQRFARVDHAQGCDAAEALDALVAHVRMMRALHVGHAARASGC